MYWTFNSVYKVPSTLDLDLYLTGGYKEMSSILADQMAPLYMSPNAGGVAESQPMSTAIHMEPKLTWLFDNQVGLWACWECCWRPTWGRRRQRRRRAWSWVTAGASSPGATSFSRLPPRLVSTVQGLRIRITCSADPDPAAPPQRDGHLYQDQRALWLYFYMFPKHKFLLYSCL